MRRVLIFVVVSMATNMSFCRNFDGPLSYLSSDEGEITLGFILPIHSGSSSQKNDYDFTKSCGKFEISRALLVSQFRRSINDINKASILPKGLKLGYWILDSCSTSASAVLRVVNKWLKIKAGEKGPNSNRNRIPALVIGSYKSSISSLLAQIFEQFDIPVLGFSATSPDLSDRRRYPLYARTSASDVYQAAAIAELVSSYSFSCIHLIYTKGAYGSYGADELKSALRRKQICVGVEAGVESGTLNFQRAQLFNVVERFRNWPHVTVVVCYCEDTTARGLLTALWNERQASLDYGSPKRDFIVIGSDFWGNKMDLTGLEDVANGAVTFSLRNLGNLTEFNEWFTNPSTISQFQADPDPWYSEYSKSILNCPDFPCEITDSKKKAMKDSLDKAEDVTGLLNVSIYAAAFGLRDFLQRAPIACLKGLTAGSPIGCDWDSKSGAKQLYEALLQSNFKMWDGYNYFRFDENGDGFDPSYEVSQFTKETGYTKIGDWSLDQGLVLDVNSNEYGERLMYWPGSEPARLVTSNCSCGRNSSVAMATIRTRRPVIATTPIPMPCNNETIFWSVYGMVSKKLKKCNCNSSWDDWSDVAENDNTLIPVVTGLAIALGVVVLLIAITIFIVLARKFKLFGKISRLLSKSNSDSTKRPQKISDIPVRIMSPSWVSLRQPVVENGSLPRRRNAHLSSYQTTNIDRLGNIGKFSRPSSALPSLIHTRASNASSRSSMSTFNRVRSPMSTNSVFDSNFHSPTTSVSPGSSFFTVLAGSRESLELLAMVERWNIPPEQVAFSEQLGQGKFGIVYRGTLLQEDSTKPIEVAIKILKVLTTDSVVQFLQEGFIMQGFDHPNILKLIGITVIDERPHIIVPYQAGGNLRNYLASPVNYQSLKDSQLDGVCELLDFCLQICSGMEYLARNKCIHRDLACRNILVGDTKLLKVADFGLAKDLFEQDYYSPSTLHRPLPVRWHPPESLRLHRFEERSDVWSYGIVCWEIFSFGLQPYSSLSNAQVFDFILSGNRLDKPEFCPAEVYDQIMTKCWDEYRSQRPSFSELLRSIHNLGSDFSNRAKSSKSDAMFVEESYQEPTSFGHQNIVFEHDTDSSSHYLPFENVATSQLDLSPNISETDEINAKYES